VKHLQFLRGLGRHIDLVNRGRQAVYLDYPVHPEPRYGWGRPSHAALHELIAARRSCYRELVQRIEAVGAGLKEIPVTPRDEGPHWANGQFSGLDAATLYCLPALFQPARYVEVGSGNSTRFVRRAIRDSCLDTKITSIDPTPRAEVDDICDEVIREPLENVPLDLFERLRENDVVLFDGSHRCFQNSDVTVAFLDILPRLAPGVLVFIHDIYLPDDYPDVVTRRHYSEQYLLAVLLEADAGRRYEILLPANFCVTDAELGPEILRTWRRIAPDGVKVDSSGFLMRIST
jgi:hypothetical protein